MVASSLSPCSCHWVAPRSSLSSSLSVLFVIFSQFKNMFLGCLIFFMWERWGGEAGNCFPVTSWSGCVYPPSRTLRPHPPLVASHLDWRGLSRRRLAELQRRRSTIPSWSGRCLTGDRRVEALECWASWLEHRGAVVCGASSRGRCWHCGAWDLCRGLPMLELRSARPVDFGSRGLR